jgi:hypothetical protein
MLKKLHSKWVNKHRLHSKKLWREWKRKKEKINRRP